MRSKKQAFRLFLYTLEDKSVIGPILKMKHTKQQYTYVVVHVERERRQEEVKVMKNISLCNIWAR